MSTLQEVLVHSGITLILGNLHLADFDFYLLFSSYLDAFARSLRFFLVRSLPLSLSLFRLLSIANLKKQVEQQQAEYDRMADELAAAKGETPSTKKD